MEQNYVFMTDSDSDLPYWIADEKHIPVVQMPYTLDGEAHMDDNGRTGVEKAFFDRMRAGELVVMFPEGRINFETNATESFKSGMVLMAVRGGVPIVPVYVQKREKWYRRVRVAVGEPVDVKAMYAEKPTFSRIEEIASVLHETEEKLKNICETGGTSES